MFTHQTINIYKPYLLADFTKEQQKLADTIQKYVSNYDNTQIKASTLLLGDTGAGKSYFIDKIFDPVNLQYNGQLKTFNLHELKKILKDNKKDSKLSRDEQIKEYLKKKCINNSILDYLQPNFEKAKIILYFDEHDNQIITKGIKELLRDIININNMYRICPIIITFIDSMDQYLKQYKNNTNTFYFNQPTNKEIKNFVVKILTKEKIQFNNNDINIFCEICNNNYGLVINNIIELLNNYVIREHITKRIYKLYLTKESIDSFIQYKNKNKYIYDDIIEYCKKTLYNKLSINEMMQLFYKEKINYPNNICHYVLNNCRNNKAFKEISKILAFSDKINENIYKDQKWILSKHYGFLSCVNLASTFSYNHKNYNFVRIPYNICKNYKEHNYIFYYKFNSLNGLNNIFIAQIIINIIMYKSKKDIEDFINYYKIDYKDIIYILKINKMNKIEIPSAKNTFVKNFIENKMNNTYSIKKIKL